jgi:hypothetical protein
MTELFNHPNRPFFRSTSFNRLGKNDRKFIKELIKGKLESSVGVLEALEAMN